jgi:hypothetical protein
MVEALEDPHLAPHALLIAHNLLCNGFQGNLTSDILQHQIGSLLGLEEQADVWKQERLQATEAEPVWQRSTCHVVCCGHGGRSRSGQLETDTRHARRRANHDFSKQTSPKHLLDLIVLLLVRLCFPLRLGSPTGNQCGGGTLDMCSVLQDRYTIVRSRTKMYKTYRVIIDSATGAITERLLRERGIHDTRHNTSLCGTGRGRVAVGH